MAKKKKRQQLKIAASSNNKITKSEQKNLSKSGVSQAQIARLQAQAKAAREAERRAKEQAAARRRAAEAEAARRRAAEAKRKREEAAAKAKREAEAKRKREEAAAKAKRDADAKRKREEAEAKARRDKEAKARREAEAKRKRDEAEAKARREKEAKARRDAEEAQRRKAEKAEADKEALRIAAKADNKITKEEQRELKAAGVPQSKIDKMKASASDAREAAKKTTTTKPQSSSTPTVQSTRPTGVGAPRGEYQETPISNNLSFSNYKDSPGGSGEKIADYVKDYNSDKKVGTGVLSPAIVKIAEAVESGKELKPKDVKEIASTSTNPQAHVAALGHIDSLNISKKAEKTILESLGITDGTSFKEFIKQSATSNVVTNEEGDTIFNIEAPAPIQEGDTNYTFNVTQQKEEKKEKDFFDTKLTKEGLDAALEEYTEDQLLNYYNKGKLKIGKGAYNELLRKSDEADKLAVIGGNKRVDDDDVNKSKFSAQDKDNPTGIYYKTYKGGSGKNEILKVGNLPKHRYENSVYKDIKIVDYDASIENYDPSKLGFVKKVDEKGVAEFKMPKVERHKYDANTVNRDGKLVRSEQQRQEYALRGIANGGRVKVARIRGEKVDVKTRSNGLLERLTLSDNGTYKTTKTEYPTEVKSSSYSDLLATNSGKASRNLSIQSNISKGASAFGKANRNAYIQRGREQLNN